MDGNFAASKNEIIDERQVCRLCLQEADGMLNSSMNCEDGIDFSDKVATVLNIEMESTENFICGECFQTVCKFYTYYQHVHENDMHLKNIRTHGLESVIEYEANYDKCDSEQEIEPIFCDIIEEENLSSRITPPIESEGTSKDELVTSITIARNSPPPEEINNRKANDNNKIELPEHLKKRISKTNGDAKIKEFIDLKCTICRKQDEIFNTFKEMQMHYEKLHNTRGYVMCCGKKIYRKDRAMDHITVHINPNAFKCPVCGHNSKSRVLLRIHMKQHLPSEEWPFQCEICSQKFVLRSQLTNHKVTHLNDGEKKFVCDECGKVFALKFVLEKHKLTHSKEKNFFCKNCAKLFSSQANLTAHVQYHHNDITSKSKVQCKTCGLWYKNIQTLRTHESRHRDTRSHVCEICNRQCSSKSSLSAHIRYIHVKSKKWECSICNKSFRRKPELTEHIARHTGQILYMCSYCPKTFHSSSNFFSHRKNRHPEEHHKIISNKLTTLTPSNIGPD